MAIATSTAIAIAAGASAGASVASAKMQSNAAKNAAKTQAASADRANALAAEANRYQQSAMAPFAGAGTGAVNTLSQLLGVPSGGQFASPGMGYGGPGGGYGPPAGAPMGMIPGVGAASRLRVPYEQMPMPGGGDPGGGGHVRPGPAGPPSFGPSAATARPVPAAAGPQYDGRTPLKLSDFIARM